MWLNKVVYRHVFLLLNQYADKENLHPCFKHGFQTRPCLQLVFHWVSKPIHLTRIKCSGWVRAAWIINEFEKWCSFTTCLSSRGKVTAVFVCHRTVSIGSSLSAEDKIWSARPISTISTIKKRGCCCRAFSHSVQRNHVSNLKQTRGIKNGTYKKHGPGSMDQPMDPGHGPPLIFKRKSPVLIWKFSVCQGMKNTDSHYVLEGLSHKSGLLWDGAPITGKTTNWRSSAFLPSIFSFQHFQIAIQSGRSPPPPPRS